MENFLYPDHLCPFFYSYLQSCQGDNDYDIFHVALGKTTEPILVYCSYCNPMQIEEIKFAFLCAYLCSQYTA